MSVLSTSFLILIVVFYFTTVKSHRVFLRKIILRWTWSTIDHCGSRCKGWLGPPLTQDERAKENENGGTWSTQRGKLVENIKWSDQLEVLEVGRLILIRTKTKQDCKIWTGFIWLRTKVMAYYFVHNNLHSGFTKCNFLEQPNNYEILKDCASWNEFPSGMVVGLKVLTALAMKDKTPSIPLKVKWRLWGINVSTSMVEE
jgi:hypothetical protein